MKGNIPQQDDYGSIKQGGTDHAEAFHVATDLAQTSPRERQHILITDGEPHKATSLCKSQGITPPYNDACSSSLAGSDRQDCLCALYFANVFNNKYNTIVGAVANKNHVRFVKTAAKESRSCLSIYVTRHAFAHTRTHAYIQAESIVAAQLKALSSNGQYFEAQSFDLLGSLSTDILEAVRRRMITMYPIHVSV